MKSSFAIVALAFITLAFATTACAQRAGLTNDVTLSSSAVAVSTPTSTYQAFCDAWNQSDVAAMKSNVSAGSIALGVKLAQSQGKSLDQMVDELRRDMPPRYLAPQMRNQKVIGNTATLEVMDEPNRPWSVIYFVKEEGVWKINLEKLFRHTPTINF
jgi:hypothetical protein